MSQLNEKQKRYIHYKWRRLLSSSLDFIKDPVGCIKKRIKQKKKEKAKLKEKLDAQKGKFPFDTINGFKLISVDYTVPSLEIREQRRKEFNEERKKFLISLAEKNEKELSLMGITDKQMEEIRKGTTPAGYNVHHKLPLHGGGKNEFSNLILIPIAPHNQLHRRVLDLQVQQLTEGQSKKVMLPWSEDMVYSETSVLKSCQKKKSVLEIQKLKNTPQR